MQHLGAAFRRTTWLQIAFSARGTETFIASGGAFPMTYMRLAYPAEYFAHCALPIAAKRWCVLVRRHAGSSEESSVRVDEVVLL